MAKQQIKLENTFGRLAIARGMATPAQVEESLRAMKKLADLGMREKLGSVMVKKGYLSRGEVAQILDMQGKRASSRIEGYEIQSKLGQGAMGSVYRAKQVSLDRIVALKILSPRLAKDKSYVRRFLTEARSVAKLNHANIIQGIDVGESNKHFYFAMEYVDGVTLIEILREEGPFEEKRALEIMESIAEALDHAHRNGLVHRDVKPDNIMVTQAGDAKLCDLGLAKSATKGASATNVGNVVGTPHYIAPEQARGEHHVDIRVDIYSLGATLFHILTGRTPYSGENPTVVMTKHLTDPVDDVRGIRPELSEGVAFLVYKMMAKSAEDRYQTPAELLEDVHTIMRGKTPAQLLATFGPKRARGTGEHRRARVRVSTTRKRASGLAGLFYAVGAVVILGILAVTLLPSVNPSRPSGSSRKSRRVTVRRPPGEGRDDPAGVPSGEVAADDEARKLYEQALKYAGDPATAQNYAEIFRRFRAVAAASKGTRSAENAKAALANYRKKQVRDCNDRIRELRVEVGKLIDEDRFGEAYALWDGFPKNLLPESEATAAIIIESERKAVLDAAERLFGSLVEQAHAKAGAGDYREARRLLEGAQRIGLERVTSRLPDERERLEEAIARHGSESEGGRAAAWRSAREDIIALARSGDYEGARVMAREAASGRQLRDHAKEIEALQFDMGRLALQQELAGEGLEAKIGKGRVVVHRDGRGYTGTVTKVEDGRITIEPATRGGKPVVLVKQDLTPEDIKRHAHIGFSDAEGQYDYAMLLIYSGEPRKARPLLERCLSNRRLKDRARWHLERMKK